MKYQEMVSEVHNAISLVNMLLDDMEFARRLIDEELKAINKAVPQIEDRLLEIRMQPMFRIMIRSASATIEGACYKLKNLALYLCDLKNIPLSSDERKGIIEKKTNKEGKLVNYYLETKENIKLAFKVMYKAFSLDNEISYDEKWLKLCRAIDKRNVITHPKNQVDLEISALEYRDESIGFEWFSENLRKVARRLSNIKNVA